MCSGCSGFITLLTTDLRCENYTYGDRSIPSVSASASVDGDGKVHISLASLNPNKQLTINCPVIGDTFKKVTGEILTANEINAMNTFEKSENIKPAPFSGFTYKNGVLIITLPAKSVVVLEMTK